MRLLLGATLDVPVFSLWAAAAEAACGVNDKVSHRNAECLSARRNNYSSLYAANSSRVQNNCPHLGKVVAKVELKERLGPDAASP